jgi:hypothetical protein
MNETAFIAAALLMTFVGPFLLMRLCAFGFDLADALVENSGKIVLALIKLPFQAVLVALKLICNAVVAIASISQKQKASAINGQVVREPRVSPACLEQLRHDRFLMNARTQREYVVIEHSND